MGRYHIIGDQDTILGFRFAGVEGTVANDAEEAAAAFREAVSNESISILIITEKVQELVHDMVIAHKVSAKPPFIATVEDIWGVRSHHGTMSDLIFEAVGVRIGGEERK